MQSEDRPRSPSVTPLLAVAGVLALAAALRLYAFTWGLPDDTHMFSYHPDEFHSLRGALSLATGDLNPHFFNYGSLYLYLVAIACMIGSPGIFASLSTAAIGGPEIPAALRAFTFDARVVTVILGIATVYVVYLTARHVWGHRAGLLASSALAIMPLHVVHSHYATVDVPGAFFVALTLYFSVRLLDEPTRRNLIWAGIAAGLAASVKYSGGLVIVAPLLAWYLTLRKADDNQRVAWREALTIAGCAAAAFALTSPYTFLDWGNAWRDISFEMAHMRTGDDLAAMAADPNGWWFHLKQLNLALTWPLLAVAIWSGAAGILQRRRSVITLVVFAALAFIVIGSAQVRYARYEMVLLPVVAVLIGWVAQRTGLRLKDDAPKAIGGPIICVGFVAAAWLSVLWLMVMGHVGFDDPRQTIASWAKGVVADGGTIGLVSEPWFHHPPLDYCNGGPALRSNPIWGAYRRPVADFVVTGLDPNAIREPLPRAFIFSEYDMAAPPEQVSAFQQTLLKNYSNWWKSDSGTGIWWTTILSPSAAHDWLYPFPVIYWCPSTSEAGND